jgi:four helix bundle protein
MSQESLENFRAYGLAMELFDLVAEDMEALTGRFHLTRLISQQLASADSISANIEEGHGRQSTREYIHYLVIARGSARETRGRYRRMSRWLSSSTVEDRCKLLDQIIGILSRTISTLRRNQGSAVREEPELYVGDDCRQPI